MLFALKKRGSLFTYIGFVSYSTVSLEMSFYSFILVSKTHTHTQTHAINKCVLGADGLLDTISK